MKNPIAFLVLLFAAALCGCQSTGKYMIYLKQWDTPPPRLATDLQTVLEMGDDARLLGSTRDGWTAVEGDLEAIIRQERVSVWTKQFDATRITDPCLGLILLTNDGFESPSGLPTGVSVKDFSPKDGMVVLEFAEPITGKLIGEILALGWVRYMEVNHRFYID